ncbi:hypothetical protein BGZ54_004269 [Gamsiella multidivaricata]|nr:hypothetical protein BGZ54_004269 [Gamsiella multidivaricata]
MVTRLQILKTTEPLESTHGYLSFCRETEAPGIIITANWPVLVTFPGVKQTSIGAGNTTSGGNGMSGGAIAGMIAGVIVILVGSVVGGFLLLKQRRKRMMLVGRNARSYNGYPEPDLDRPPMAAYKREGRPNSGFGQSTHVQSGIYDDKSHHAAAAGIGGAKMPPGGYNGGHGLGSGFEGPYTQLNNSTDVATGSRGDDVILARSAGTMERDSRVVSVELDLQQLERERQLDLEQQERLLRMADGESYPSSPSAFQVPLPSSPSSSSSPTSPRGPYASQSLMPGSATNLQHRGSGVYNYNMNHGGDAQPHLQRPLSEYQQQPYQSPYDPRGGYGSYPQGSGPMPMRPYSQQFPPPQHPQHPQHIPYPFPLRPTSAVVPRPSTPMNPMVPLRPSATPCQKQEYEEVTTMSNISHMSGLESPSSISDATSPIFPATNSVKSNNSAEPLFHGAGGDGNMHLKHVDAISNILPPSMDTTKATPTEMGEKEEFLPASAAVVPTIASRPPPPLPMTTKPTR